MKLFSLHGELKKSVLNLINEYATKHCADKKWELVNSNEHAKAVNMMKNTRIYMYAVITLRA